MIKIPLNFLYGVQDARLQRLLGKVWRRLPAYDRAVLRELVLDVSDQGQISEHAIAHAGPVNPDSVWNGNAGDAALDMYREITLTNARDVKSDPACMAGIAHEFAHVVLRHIQISLVVQELTGFNPPLYTDSDIDQLKALHEDEANLQVWVWGFQSELKALFDEFPDMPRPRWYVDLESEPWTGSNPWEGRNA